MELVFLFWSPLHRTTKDTATKHEQSSHTFSNEFFWGKKESSNVTILCNLRLALVPFFQLCTAWLQVFIRANQESRLIPSVQTRLLIGWRGNLQLRLAAPGLVCTSKWFVLCYTEIHRSSHDTGCDQGDPRTRRACRPAQLTLFKICSFVVLVSD